ncbi:MAG: hypothetical protein ACK5MT_00625 [Actinomycetales bacterium]
MNARAGRHTLPDRDEPGQSWLSEPGRDVPCGYGGVVLMRAYRLTLEQFGDVLTQEMHRAPAAAAGLGLRLAPLLDFPETGRQEGPSIVEQRALAPSVRAWGRPGATAPGQSGTSSGCCAVRLGSGRYETVYRLGWLDGEPVLTFAPGTEAGCPINAPAPAYLATLVEGIREAHGLGDAEIGRYLTACPGAGTWSAQDIGTLAPG